MASYKSAGQNTKKKLAGVAHPSTPNPQTLNLVIWFGFIQYQVVEGASQQV